MKAIRLKTGADLQISSTHAKPGNISQHKFNRIFETAFGCMLSGEWDKALPDFFTLYLHDTTNPNICYMVGVCLAKLRREPKQAIILFEKAGPFIHSDYKKGDPEERRAPVTTFYYLGELHFMEGNFEASLTTYTKYLRLLPSSGIIAKNETEFMIATVKTALGDSDNRLKNSS